MVDVNRISLVGVGGGGCTVVDAVADVLAVVPPTKAVNTDSRALAECRCVTKLEIGARHARGLGTGGDANVGNRAASDDLELIRGLFEDVALAVIAAGLGGGTGTGALPVVLNAAREAGTLTVCCVTLPFPFEGRERRALAERALPALQEAADILLVVPNDRLFAFTGEAELLDAFRSANRTLACALAGVWRLVTRPGYINLDASDLRKMAHRTEGWCTLGFGEGVGEDRGRVAVAQLLEGPLLREGAVLAGAQAILVSITGGVDLALKEVGDIMDAVSAAAPAESHIFMGTVLDEEWGDRVTVTLVASEEWRPQAPAEEPKQEEGEEEAPEPGGDKPPAEPRKRRRRSGLMQANLGLDTSAGKGRFKDVEPTIMDGEDLDIPTFRRRNIPIEK
jgi:cell division protein FtsZ